MKYAISKVIEMPLTIIFAVLLGIVFSTYLPILRDTVLSYYDSYYPVIDYKSEIVGKTDDAVLVHVYGEKLRNCNVVPDSLDSFTIRKGRLYDALEVRISGYKANRPVGSVDLGVWKIWPTHEAKQVQMWVLHDCNGHLVRSKIVDVKL